MTHKVKFFSALFYQRTIQGQFLFDLDRIQCHYYDYYFTRNTL